MSYHVYYIVHHWIVILKGPNSASIYVREILGVPRVTCSLKAAVTDGRRKKDGRERGGEAEIFRIEKGPE